MVDRIPTSGADERALDRLLAALDGEPVVAAWIFGSRAAGALGPLSDVDVGILPRYDLGTDARFRLRLRTSVEAAAAFGTDSADVVLVDEAAPSIAFAAIGGRLVLDRDPGLREIAEARIMSRYHDRVARDEAWEADALDRYARGEFA